MLLSSHAAWVRGKCKVIGRYKFYEYESLVHRTNLKVGVVWGMALEFVTLLCVCVCERVVSILHNTMYPRQE